MEFQIQVKNLGTARQKAQISFRDPAKDRPTHLEFELTELSMSRAYGEDSIRSVQGNIPELGRVMTLDEVSDLSAEGDEV